LAITTRLRAQRGTVLHLDVARVMLVVTRHQRSGFGRRCGGRAVAAFAPPVPAVAARLRRVQRLAAESADLRHEGAGDLDRVVLLGHRTVLGQVIDRVVDAADERHGVVDHHQLAMHAAKHAEPPAEQASHRLVAAHPHPGGEQRTEQLGTEVRRSPAVDQHMHLRAVASRLQQRLLQLAAHLVVHQDEGLEQHLAPRLRDGLEHTRVVRLSVLEQDNLVAVGPSEGHSWISAASGAWSDSVAHGSRGRGNGCASAT
jgi:hypothetical protein